MNSPLPLICSKYNVPQELENIIQSYMSNDFMYKALQEYYHYLYYMQELYDDFVYENYISPNCYCCPGLIARRRECSHCYYYEYTYKYKMQPYIQCIMENEQYAKIIQNHLTSL